MKSEADGRRSGRPLKKAKRGEVQPISSRAVCGVLHPDNYMQEKIGVKLQRFARRTATEDKGVIRKVSLLACSPLLGTGAYP